MRKTELRQQDILKLIEGLDISPTMYKNATDKYKTSARPVLFGIGRAFAAINFYRPFRPIAFSRHVLAF